MVDAIDSSKKNRTTVILNSSRDVAYLKFMMYNHLQNNYFFSQEKYTFETRKVSVSQGSAETYFRSGR